ncbi:MAG TPA: 50S ribosomal protein L27 [Gammaproteobacteria bacterium]|jgi:large subunit ribosomal protein L27
MAHKKAGGSTRNGRDSESKRLGVKVYGGEAVVSGNIIIRQRGTEYRAGQNVKMGRDHTLFAVAAGHIKFEEKGKPVRRYVSVVASEPATAK